MTNATWIALLCLLILLRPAARGSAIFDHPQPPGVAESRFFSFDLPPWDPGFDWDHGEEALLACDAGKGDRLPPYCEWQQAPIGIWMAAAIAGSARGRPLVWAREILQGDSPEHSSEPPTVWLLIGGVIALAAWRIRRRA